MGLWLNAPSFLLRLRRFASYNRFTKHVCVLNDAPSVVTILCGRIRRNCLLFHAADMLASSHVLGSQRTERTVSDTAESDSNGERIPRQQGPCILFLCTCASNSLPEQLGAVQVRADAQVKMVAAAAHDLQTPLAAIKSGCRVLAMQGLTENSNQVLAACARRLLHGALIVNRW